MELLPEELWEHLIPLVFLLFFLAVFLARVLREDQRAASRYPAVPPGNTASGVK